MWAAYFGDADQPVRSETVAASQLRTRPAIHGHLPAFWVDQPVLRNLLPGIQLQLGLPISHMVGPAGRERLHDEVGAPYRCPAWPISFWSLSLRTHHPCHFTIHSSIFRVELSVDASADSFSITGS